MFYYLEGKIALIEQNIAVIDVGGAGYAVHTSGRTVSGIKQGENARLYTCMNIREDVFEIYGFLTLAELSCYRMLTSISGVGPKAAVSILSASSPESLALSILTEDERALTIAPGIGRKIAQRIILELKDKLSKEQLHGAPAIKGAAAQAQIGGTVTEAQSALMVLGYSYHESASALRGVDAAGATTEELVRLALKSLAKS